MDQNDNQIQWDSTYDLRWHSLGWKVVRRTRRTQRLVSNDRRTERRSTASMAFRTAAASTVERMRRTHQSDCKEQAAISEEKEDKNWHEQQGSECRKWRWNCLESPLPFRITFHTERISTRIYTFLRIQLTRFIDRYEIKRSHTTQ